LGPIVSSFELLISVNTKRESQIELKFNYSTNSKSTAKE